MTRLGILSDSHGRAEITRSAVNLLIEHGAERLIHLGDFERPEVIEELCPLPAHIVFGNCDWNLASLERTARSLDIAVDHPAGRLTIDGRVIAYTHGDQPSELDRALREGVQYLLHGHTHLPRDERLGPTRIINPGALFRAARYTAAVLDPVSDALTFIEIPNPASI